MVNELAHKYLDHPQRAWITWALAGTIAIVLALPAWDAWSAARDETATLTSELVGTTMAVSNLEAMKKKLTQVSAAPDPLDNLVDLERADQIRERVARLVHEMDCQMRRLTLGDPITRAWTENDNPFSTTPPENASETGFQIQSRRLNVVVEGTLAQLGRLTTALTELDRFAVPIEMTLRREDVNGHLRLDINISLFNLIETND